MRFLPILLPLLLVSCGPRYYGWSHANGDITIAERGFLQVGYSDLEIQGAEPGKVTPASRLTVTETITFKIRQSTPLNCEGYVDRTAPERAEIRLATDTRVQPSLHGTHQDGWCQSRFNGDHRLSSTSR